MPKIFPVFISPTCRCLPVHSVQLGLFLLLSDGPDLQLPLQLPPELLLSGGLHCQEVGGHQAGAQPGEVGAAHWGNSLPQALASCLTEREGGSQVCAPLAIYLVCIGLKSSAMSWSRQSSWLSLSKPAARSGAVFAMSWKISRSLASFLNLWFCLSRFLCSFLSSPVSILSLF